MSVRPCPECQHPAPRVLESLSNGALVWYYRCPECAHVWNVPKDDPDGVQTSNIETRQRGRTSDQMIKAGLTRLPTIVLCAGLGTRLAPITDALAKAAVPMAGKTLIERVLEWLKGQGIADVVINLHHRPASITAIVGDGSEWGLRVRYSWEPILLGSAGGPRQALTLWPTLTGPCLIVNGDTLTDLALAPLIEAHRASGARATLAVIRNPRPDHYNGIRANGDGTVTEFVARGHSDPTWHFVGVQVVEADVFGRIPIGEPAETVSGLYREMVRDAPGSVKIWPVDAPFLDVGTPADYLAAVFGLAGTDVVVERDSVVHPSATLHRCVVWSGARVGAGARLTDCVVLTGADVAPGTTATGQVLGI